MRCTSIVWFCCIRALLAPESHDTSLADCLESVGVNAGCRACKALAQATNRFARAGEMLVADGRDVSDCFDAHSIPERGAGLNARGVWIGPAAQRRSASSRSIQRTFVAVACRLAIG
jgi:hypothetical protein